MIVVQFSVKGPHLLDVLQCGWRCAASWLSAATVVVRSRVDPSDCPRLARWRSLAELRARPYRRQA